MANETDYVEHLLKARKLLREVDLGELIQDKRFHEAKTQLKKAIIELEISVNCIFILEIQFLNKEKT